ncbi:Dna2/Cas4 domain-containing protein [Actinobacteria bacterium YIM 96077]|uniref:PD-(D/E)XK endonuclease-like domain-containing protein n=1 Tax=Phytoactinopolyspora halophila TaxID=1981511 RepID=A0A329QKT2_9ACTN|nr:PD-(D/E)XK nuclease family protein [Phytoactinopolyspora halophila]AYY11582.1 Dna2/Cas4 domain-containing protein [Actinobacteria bacterium YIM 96077]RAW11128.1 hypothetical protein DPM12_17450 [Phytoactinopolyspora halophila]
MQETETQELFGEWFDRHLQEELKKTDFPLEEWIHTGKATKEWPDKESIDWWTTHGPAMLQRFAEWRKAKGWPIWVTPDGQRAIELEYKVPWIEDKAFYGFIDRIYVHPYTGELIVVDIKSGSSYPNERQLGEYACAIEEEYGVRPRWGMYLMLRRDPEKQVMVDLSEERFSVEYLKRESQEIQKGIDNQVFFTVPSSLCNTCTVAKHCVEGKK